MLFIYSFFFSIFSFSLSQFHLFHHTNMNRTKSSENAWNRYGSIHPMLVSVSYFSFSSSVSVSFLFLFYFLIFIFTFFYSYIFCFAFAFQFALLRLFSHSFNHILVPYSLVSFSFTHLFIHPVNL